MQALAIHARGFVSGVAMAAAMVPNPNVEDSRLCGQHQDMTVVTEHNAAGKPTEPVTPPPSDESSKGRDSHVSELSDLELEDEEEEEDIEPDHYYDGGKIPVFKPVSRSLWLLVLRIAEGRSAYNCLRSDYGPIPELQEIRGEN